MTTDRALNNLKRYELEKLISNYTKEGIRVIALATSNNSDQSNFKELTLVGILLIKDEIRKEAKKAIELTKKAGIKTVMITGDNKDTAISIGKEVGIYKEGDLVLTSEELNRLNDEEVIKIEDFDELD